MTHPRYRTLLGAALAALFIGAAIAQTTSDDPSKRTPQAEQTRPADVATDKMQNDSDAQGPASDQAAQKPSTEPAKHASVAKTSKPAKQASKSQAQPIAAAEPAEKIFRQALRQCAKEHQQSQRDSCLDSAIEQFQRG